MCERAGASEHVLDITNYITEVSEAERNGVYPFR